MTEQAVPLEAEPYAGGMDATTARRVKITVWVSPERPDRARKAAARGRAPSISAWVEEAVRKHDSNFGWDDEWDAIFAEWDRDFGPPSEAVRAWARRVVLGT